MSAAAATDAVITFRTAAPMTSPVESTSPATVTSSDPGPSSLTTRRASAMRAAAASAATAGIRSSLSGVSPRSAVNRSLLLANAMTADVPAVRLVTHESWKDHPALRLAMREPSP